VLWHGAVACMGRKVNAICLCGIGMPEQEAVEAREYTDRQKGRQRGRVRERQETRMRHERVEAEPPPPPPPPPRVRQQ